ncbi:hypothetical protein MMC27_001898 [Xylographa pallens]|nr:hypothetical protein [Xylographa pallens]
MCHPYLGTHISEQDCRAAFHDLFDPLFRQQPPASALQAPRIFHLYDPNEWKRMPRGITVGSCSLAIDIESSHGVDAISSWFMHYSQMFELIQACVLDGALGQGGNSNSGNGFVFTIVNPSVVNIANTCMVNHGPRRMDIAQCVIGEAVRAARPANIPAPRPNGPTSVRQPNLLGSSGIDLVNGGHVGGGPAARIPAGAPMLDNSMNSETLDSEMLDFVLNLPPAPDTGDGPSDTGSSAPGPSVPNTFGADSQAGPVTVEDGRTLPSAPPQIQSIRQHTYVGGSNKVVGGTWILQNGRWVDGWRKSGWKSHGEWWLVLGRGQPTPYPGGIVPLWRGEGAKPILVNQHTNRPNQPVAEAWIAREGTWQPLEGIVLPVGPWVTTGGWVLLKGEITR